MYEDLKKEILLKIDTAQNLIPVQRDSDLPPTSLIPNIPDWHTYESEIWKLGEEIRQLFLKDKSLFKDEALIRKILNICLNRNSKRGRQSFILLLGNPECTQYSDALVSELQDEFVDGQVIDTLFKMKAPQYKNVIAPFCQSKVTWIRNAAKKYIKKYGNIVGMKR